jgi:hypothetical protein
MSVIMLNVYILIVVAPRFDNLQCLSPVSFLASLK